MCPTMGMPLVSSPTHGFWWRLHQGYQHLMQTKAAYSEVSEMSDKIFVCLFCSFFSSPSCCLHHGRIFQWSCSFVDGRQFPAPIQGSVLVVFTAVRNVRDASFFFGFWWFCMTAIPAIIPFFSLFYAPDLSAGVGPLLPFSLQHGIVHCMPF